MSRERITITIKEDMLTQIDRMVDGLHIRSRSQAFEYLLSKILSDYKLRQALILAGGPKKEIVISKSPKFILDIKGKNLIERIMESIADYNVSNFILYTDSFSEQIIENVKDKKMPYNIEYLSGEKPTGTIEPLMKARHKINDTFLVAYGDTITSINLNEMLEFHKRRKSIATIALTTVSNPKEHGVAMLEGDKVKTFVQKPTKEIPSYLINAGYFLFEPEIFKYIGRNMKSLEKDLLPKFAKKGLLYGYPFQGIYLNVNTKTDLEKARLIL